MRDRLRCGVVRLASLLALCAASSGAAQEAKRAVEAKKEAPLFYTGPLEVQSVRGVIDLGSPASPRLSVSVGVLRESGTVLSMGAGEPVRVQPSEREQTLDLVPLLARSGKAGGPQEVALDLRLLANGLPIARPLDQARLDVVLPAGVPALLRSNQDVERVTLPDGRTAYRLVKARYLTSWRVVWSEGPVTLELDKKLDPPRVTQAQQPVKVTLRVRNLGRAEARAVALLDDFDPRDFEGVGSGFQIVKGEANDQRLLWRGTIDRLAAGAETTVEYSVRSRQGVHGVSLPGVRATIGDELVGVSNKVLLPPAK